MKKIILAQFIILISMYSATAYCNITLIKSEFYKDGGTRCVEYKRGDKVVKCCIDGRMMARDPAGTHEVFIGGYPSDKNARVISLRELIAVYDDILEIMENDEYKKYAAMTHDQVMALARIDDHKIDKLDWKEYRKAHSYQSLPSFKNYLLIQYLLFNKYLWASLLVILLVSYYLYRQSRRKANQNK
jgi:hypothetical protein